MKNLQETELTTPLLVSSDFLKTVSPANNVNCAVSIRERLTYRIFLEF